MKSAFLVRTRDKKPFFSVLVSDEGSKFTALTENAKELVSALVDEYEDAPIPKAELSVSLDRGMTIDGPMPVNQLPSAIKKARMEVDEESNQKKTLLPISISDSPISIFSTDEAKAIISYKASAFVAERHKTTFNYEVKRVRATWDPGLSIPGTNRRGGWRCPTGTRYGGQITDRFGRNCGWGVARRLANAITNIGERLENVDDRRRGRRVNRRNERMIGRLQNDERGGRLERGLRGIAERLEGDNQNQTPDAIEAPRAPRRPSGANRQRRQPRAVDAPPAPVRQERQPRPARPQRGNLRDSERRRMQREIENPGAPRTGEETTPQIPQGEAQPVAPTPRPRRQRRRVASEQQAERVATRRPQAEDVPDAGAQPKKPVKRRVSKPRADNPAPQVDELPEQGLDGASVNRLINGADITDEKKQEFVEQQRSAQARIDNNSAQLRENMPIWRAGDQEELQANINLQQNRVKEKKRQFEEAARNLALVETNDNMGSQLKKVWRAQFIQQMIRHNEDYMMHRQNEQAMKRRLSELRGENPNRPEPPAPQAPQAANPPAAPEVQQEPEVFVEKAPRNVVRLELKKEILDGVQAKINAEKNPTVRADLQDKWDLLKVNADQRLVYHELANWRTLASNWRGPLSENAQISFRRRASQTSFRTKQEAEQRLVEQRNALEQKLGANDFAVALGNQRERDAIQTLMYDVLSLENALKNWDSDSAMFQRLSGGKPNYFDPNSKGAQQKREALGDVGDKIKNEISDAVNKRQGILAKYVEGRYGKNGGQWKDMNPERWASLSDDEKLRYIKDAYSHEKIVGTNGKIYQFVASSSGRGNNFRVAVTVNEIDSNGNVIRMNVGRSSRDINLAGQEVYNASFFIEKQSDRGAGLQTIYNQHAFMYLNQIGVTKARVTAVDDGAFVWARIGYKRGAPSNQPFQQALLNYSKFGPGGLISNEEEYWRVRYLVDKANAGGRVTHQDYIFAVASSTADRQQRYMREEQIKQWFKGNASFSGGILRFSDQQVGPNPGQKPAPRRRRAPRRVASRV